MPRKKRFQFRVEVMLPESLAEFLDSLVERGWADSISAAVRKCVAIAKNHIPEASEGEKRSGQ
ncbi:MAG: hypothetical protein QW175_06675 [Candidatus Bathyarchaeia archaeon]